VCQLPAVHGAGQQAALILLHTAIRVHVRQRLGAQGLQSQGWGGRQRAVVWCRWVGWWGKSTGAPTSGWKGGR
jgi:hypothetical protein